MSYALHTALDDGGTREGTTHFGCLEICEVTGKRLYRAGEYAAAGEYKESETGRCVTLSAPDFLPARLDGKIACYYLMRRGWGETMDQALVRRQMQFQILIARSHQRLYNFARRTMNNSQDAEDISQETLARAWKRFETFDPQRSFDAWIFRIASNLMIDYKRRSRYRQEVSLSSSVYSNEDEQKGSLELSDCTSDPQTCLMAKEISASLQSALYSLPRMHQETLRLVAQQRSYEEIAKTFDCPVGTVRSRVYRARVMLKRHLKERTTHE